MSSINKSVVDRLTNQLVDLYGGTNQQWLDAAMHDTLSHFYDYTPDWKQLPRNHRKLIRDYLQSKI